MAWGLDVVARAEMAQAAPAWVVASSVRVAGPVAYVIHNHVLLGSDRDRRRGSMTSQQHSVRCARLCAIGRQYAYPSATALTMPSESDERHDLCCKSYAVTPCHRIG